YYLCPARDGALDSPVVSPPSANVLQWSQSLRTRHRTYPSGLTRDAQLDSVSRGLPTPPDRQNPRAPLHPPESARLRLAQPSQERLRPETPHAAIYVSAAYRDRRVKRP